MSPRHPRACVRWEMHLFCSKVKQRTLLYTVVEGGDVGDELHVDDAASFAGICIAEDFEGEGRLGNLRGIYRCGFIARNVRGAIGGWAAGRCVRGWCGGDCGVARLSDGNRCAIGVDSGCAIEMEGGNKYMEVWTVRVGARELTWVKLTYVGLPGLRQVLHPVRQLHIR